MTDDTQAYNGPLGGIELGSTPSAPVIPAAEGPQLHRIAGKVLGQPLLIAPEMGEVIGHVLAGRVGIDAPGPLSPEASRFLGTYRRDERDGGLTRATGGVAIISIVGSLVNRGAWIGASSGLVSYEGISAQIADAAADPEVDSIVLDIDSPGGEATGVFGLAEEIRAVEKPVVAFVNDVAASAGYAIAAAADEVVVSPSSIVGSIGVVMIRADMTENLAKDGIKVDVFTAGRFKADGHPFTEMNDQERKRISGMIDRFYGLFVSSVAAGRGDRLTEDQARATEAAVFIGEDAIAAGLADRVGTLGSILETLKKPAPGAGQSRQRSMTMSKETTAPEAGASEAQIEAARTEGHAAGAAAERERIGAILTADAAEGREAQARALALETDLAPEAAVKVLEASPKAEAKPRTPTIEERARTEPEMGHAPRDAGGAKAANGWSKAVADANASLGIRN